MHSVYEIVQERFKLKQYKPLLSIHLNDLPTVHFSNMYNILFIIISAKKVLICKNILNINIYIKIHGRVNTTRQARKCTNQQHARENLALQ